MTRSARTGTSKVDHVTRTGSTAGEGVSLNTPQMRRILASSFLGSAIEYYDFLLYATAAAIVFNKIFFVGLGPGFAAFASFGTLAAGYVARPLGGAVFGHFGDRFGRKGVLIITMFSMGIATTLIGLLPTTAQVGVSAPVLLIVLRLVQGLAVGGEWGGAMLIAIEHAPGGKRGFAASFANLGAPAGAILGTLAVSAFTLLPDAQFFSWGWRVPFLLSAVLIAIGLVVRLKVAESPLYQEFEKEAERRHIPFFEVFARYKKSLLLGVSAGIAMLTIAGIATVWALSFAVDHGADKTDVLNAKIFAAVSMFVMTVISAHLCDRVGRKPMIAGGIVAAIAFVFPMLHLVQTGSATSYAVAVIAAQDIQGVILGPLASFMAELFPTRVRFTGASLSFQVASVLGAGFTPSIAVALVLADGGGTTMLGLAWIATLAVCLVLVLMAKEGRHRGLAEIA